MSENERENYFFIFCCFSLGFGWFVAGLAVLCMFGLVCLVLWLVVQVYSRLVLFGLVLGRFEPICFCLAGFGPT